MRAAEKLLERRVIGFIGNNHGFLTLKASLAGACCVLLVILSETGFGAEQNQVVNSSLNPETVTVEQVEPTVVGLDQYSDPLEPLNRIVFAFNDKSYRYVLVPLGNAYEAVVLQPVRTGISQFFRNLQEPLHLLNHALQGNLGGASRNMFRFVVNTVIGVAGIFDPAQGWFGAEPVTATFNDTFIHYQVPPGPYLVLPFLGGADLRRSTSIIVSSTLHPVRVVTHEPDTTYIIVFDNFQTVAPGGDRYIELSNQAEDPYLYFRNQYLQGIFRDQRMQADEEQ